MNIKDHKLSTETDFVTGWKNEVSWKRTKKMHESRIGELTFGKLNPVGQISAVAAFKQLQLVVTWLVIVAEP